MGARTSEQKHYLRVDLHHLNTGSIFYTRGTKHLSESQSSAAVLYTVRGPVIAVTLNGIFGGWIADNRCNTVGAEFSKLWFTFQTMTKCRVSAMSIYVYCKSNSQTLLTAIVVLLSLSLLTHTHTHTLDLTPSHTVTP